MHLINHSKLDNTNYCDEQEYIKHIVRPNVSSKSSLQLPTMASADHTCIAQSLIDNSNCSLMQIKSNRDAKSISFDPSKSCSSVANTELKSPFNETEDRHLSNTDSTTMSTETKSCKSNTSYKIAEHVKSNGKVKDISKTCKICQKIFTCQDNFLLHMACHSMKQKMFSAEHQGQYETEENKNNENYDQIYEEKEILFDQGNDEKIHIVFPSDYQMSSIQPNDISNDKTESTSDILSVMRSISHVEDGPKELVSTKDLTKCSICKKNFTCNTNLNKHLIEGKCKQDIVTKRFSFSNTYADEDLHHTNISTNYEADTKERFLENNEFDINDETIPIVYPSDCIPSLRFMKRYGSPNRSLDIKEVPSANKESPNNEHPKDCNICGKTFKRGYDLRKHSITHKKGFIFNRFNDDMTNGEEMLRSSVLGNMEHSSITPSKKFFCKKNINTTRTRNKSNIDSRTCQICQKVFTRSTTLRRHMNIHQKPGFKCDICQSNFSSKDKLNCHFKFCSLNKKLANYISYSSTSPEHKDCASDGTLDGVTRYSHKGNMLICKNEKDHIQITKIVSDPMVDKQCIPNAGYDNLFAKAKSKLFSRTCKVCKKTFSRTTTLRRHMLIHKRSNFRCEKCQVCFSNLDVLNRHLVKCKHSVNSVQTSSNYSVTTLASSNHNSINDDSVSLNISGIDMKNNIKGSLLSPNSDSLLGKSPKDVAISNSIIIVKPLDHQSMISYKNSMNSNMISLKHGAVQFSEDIKQIKSASFGRDIHQPYLTVKKDRMMKDKSSQALDELACLSTPNGESFNTKSDSIDVSDEVLTKCSQVKWKQKAARTCQICHKTFSRTTTLRRHMNIHSRKASFRCGKCHLDVQGQDAFNLHCKDCNKSNEPVKSDIIIDLKKPVTSSKPGISSNRKNKRIPNISNKTCHLCQKIFTRTTTLRRHLLTHKNKPVFECEKCRKIFHSKDVRDSHQAGCSDTPIDLNYQLTVEQKIIKQTNNDKEADVLEDTNLKTLNSSLKVVRCNRFSS